jgi:ketol-acid reductoisomerase
MAHHSTTSQYGTLTRAQGLINAEIRARMRQSLVKDIKGGAFAQEWSQEQAAGSQILARLREAALNNEMSQAEERVIPVVQRAHALS